MYQIFLKKICIFYENIDKIIENATLKLANKLNCVYADALWGEVAKSDFRCQRGVSRFLTLADQGGRGGHPPCYVNTLLRQNQILFSNNILYVPSLSLFKYDVNKEGDSSFTDIR